MSSEGSPPTSFRPRYETFTHQAEDERDRFLLALSPDGREGSARIGQDAFFSVASLSS